MLVKFITPLLCSFSSSRGSRILIGLVLFHFFIIILSNYLVQLPVSVFGFTTTWGAFSFPFVFLATDLTVRIFGICMARRIIFIVMVPALLTSYCISSLFYQGEWQGFAILATLNFFAIRIAFASFIAYLLGQILDVYVFDYFRHQFHWCIAPNISTLVGNAFDTLLFFLIAFYKSQDPFIAAYWFEIAIVDYVFKTIINMIFFIPTYGILLNLIFKHLIHQCGPALLRLQ